VFSVQRYSAMLLACATAWAAPETLLWESGRVIAVEQVSSPPKELDPTCRAVPKGATPPARCRTSNLAAEQFWRVTVEAGNKRFVVLPYRAPGLLDSLNQGGRVYVDPNLTTASAVEVAVTSSKAVRLRTDQGQGIPAIVESQELLSSPAAPLKAESSPPRTKGTAPVPSAFKVVLLENGDFEYLEIQELKPEEIGDGAALYSFTGDSSGARIASGRPVLLVLAETGAAISGTVELSRLQVGQGNRQLVYSLTKKRSASWLPIIVTQVSATVRKVTVRDPLPPGQYVVHVENSDRAFLFETR
jgi:hypothetical protein